MSEIRNERSRPAVKTTASRAQANRTFRLPESTLGAADKVRFALRQIGEEEECGSSCCSTEVLTSVLEALQASESENYKPSPFEQRHLSLYKATAELHKEMGYHNDNNEP